ncbi:MAG: hypothetical protein ACP5VR_07430 [Acidimicrobiales bacterium]
MRALDEVRGSSVGEVRGRTWRVLAAVVVTGGAMMAGLRLAFAC